MPTCLLEGNKPYLTSSTYHTQKIGKARTPDTAKVDVSKCKEFCFRAWGGLKQGPLGFLD